MGIIPVIAFKILKKYNNFDNYLLILDAYSRLPRPCGMESITAEEVMDKLNIFQSKFGKLDEFVWWDLEIIQTDTDRQFISKEFQKGLSVRGLSLTLAVTDHQEMNGQVEVMWQTSWNIAHSIMVHARVLN